MRLIAGVAEATEGMVLVDDVPASYYPSEELVKHVGYISAETVIFQGTILENITAFDDRMESRALELVRMLNLDKEIAMMPKGYETQVTDGIADIVAPGIKQRMAIARVLLHKPKIILFHNADRGLDREGYSLLIKFLNLLKGKATMIIVTEDHNINRLADKHYLLKDGKLEEMAIEDSNAYDAAL